MTLDWDGKIRMDCSSPNAMASLIARQDEFAIATGNDTDADRHGIVTPDGGLMNPNHYLSVAIDYLYSATATRWPAGAAVGKTLVSSSMIDRVAACIWDRRLLEVPVGFKWFVPGLLDGSVAFGGEESAGASFLQRDGSVWTTDKDGIILCLLASEITAVTGSVAVRALPRVDGSKHGDPAYARIDSAATREQKAVLWPSSRPSRSRPARWPARGSPRNFTRAPGNDAALGGLKVVDRIRVVRSQAVPGTEGRVQALRRVISGARSSCPHPGRGEVDHRRRPRSLTHRTRVVPAPARRSVRKPGQSERGAGQSALICRRNSLALGVQCPTACCASTSGSLSLSPAMICAADDQLPHVDALLAEHLVQQLGVRGLTGEGDRRAGDVATRRDRRPAVDEQDRARVLTEEAHARARPGERPPPARRSRTRSGRRDRPAVVSSTGRMKSFCGSGLYCRISIGPRVSVTCSRAFGNRTPGSRTSATKPAACTPSSASSAARASSRPWCREISPTAKPSLAEAARNGGAQSLACTDDCQCRHDDDPYPAAPAISECPRRAVSRCGPRPRAAGSLSKLPSGM